MENYTTIYKPNQRHEMGIFMTWAVMAQNIYVSRELIWVLFKRDFFAQYKKSFLGMGWIIVAPIIGIVSWVFLQKTGVLNPGDVKINYTAYVLVGSSVWGLFMGFLTASSETLSAGEGFILQVNYPHETLLVKQVGSQLANFLITLVLNIAVLIYFEVPLSWKIIFFPLVALPMFFAASSLGLLVSMVSAISMDIQKAITIIFQLMFFITPVVYSNKMDNAVLQAVIKWNPLTYLVCSARDIIIEGKLYDTQGFFITAGVSFILFLISWRLFFISENKVIERMI